MKGDILLLLSVCMILDTKLEILTFRTFGKQLNHFAGNFGYSYINSKVVRNEDPLIMCKLS